MHNRKHIDSFTLVLLSIFSPSWADLSPKVDLEAFLSTFWGLSSYGTEVSQCWSKMRPHFAPLLIHYIFTSNTQLDLEAFSCLSLSEVS